MMLGAALAMAANAHADEGMWLASQLPGIAGPLTKAGFKGDLGILDADDSFLRGGHGDFKKGIEVGGTGEVRVNIDQSGQNGVLAEIDFCISGLPGRGAGCGQANDGLALNDDSLVCRLSACFHIEDVTGAYKGTTGLLCLEQDTSCRQKYYGYSC